MGQVARKNPSTWRDSVAIGEYNWAGPAGWGNNGPMAKARASRPAKAGKITWMVLARDVSHAIRVTGEDTIVAVLVLDTATGLIRGLSAGPTPEAAMAESFSMALTKPAGNLPAGPPDSVLVPVGMAQPARKTLSGLRLGSFPSIAEVVAGTEAEDIFDSFISHMSGRIQPPDPPQPADWQFLYDQVFSFYRAAPWTRFDDDIDFEVTVDLGGEEVTYGAVIMGGAGITYGLALYPGKAVRPNLKDWKPPEPWPLPPGALTVTLDPWGEVPPEMTARASRYGWPTEADLVPTFFGLDAGRGREFSGTDARRFAMATAAMVAFDARAPVPAARRFDATTGHVVVPGVGTSSYSVRQLPSSSE